ncbi:MAG: SMP-30/gluconolactonase/LRE family protein [bacterium]
MKRFLFAISIAASFVIAASAATLAQTAKGPGAAQTILADKLTATEGIAVCPDGKMYTIDNGSKIYEVVDDTTVKLFAEGLTKAAGLACGPKGDLYAAEYGAGSVAMVSADGKTKKTLASGFKNPNGIAAASDGSVYMSDSTAGVVVKILPDGTVEKLLDGINFANGLLLSPDESLLYIAQTTPNKVIVTPLAGENKGKKKTYASKLSMVDGITGDADGNLYACLFSKGEIAKVDKDGVITIIASGLYSPATPVIKDGALYITAVVGKGLYKIPLAAEK